MLRPKLLYLVYFLSIYLFKPVDGLYTRQFFPLAARDSDTCGKAGYGQCGDPNLPSNFCCPMTSTCIAVDDASTVICCPEGADCSTIQPIPCDIGLQDATEHPASSVKTTRLDDKLSKCAGACCPHGYKCDGKRCVAGDRVISEPKTSASSHSTTISTTSTTSTISTTASTTTPATTATSGPPPSSTIQTMSSTLIPSPTSQSSSVSSSEKPEPIEEKQCNSFPPGAIAAGFFPGLISGILISAACFFLHRRSSGRSPSIRTSSSHDNFRHHSDNGMVVSISGPIPSTAQDSFRTDFLRHQPDCHEDQTSRSRMQRTNDRVKSFFAPKSDPVSDPYPPELPVTPPDQIYPHQGRSGESVKLVSPAHLGDGDSRLNPPPRTNADRPPTTFSQMIETVGFQNSRGSPFYPVTSPPQPQTARFYTNTPLSRV